MAFTVQDYLDLVRLLAEHPEWRSELRRLLLSEDLLTLPDLVRELVEAQRRTEEQLAALAEAQRRTEERLGRTEEQLAALAEAQRRAEERLSRVEERLGRTEEQLAALAEAQRRAEERLSRVEERLSHAEERLDRVEEQLVALAEAQRRTEERLERLEAIVGILAEQVRALVEAQQRTDTTVGGLKGRLLEMTYRDKAMAYFGPLLRRLRVIPLQALEETLETHLSPEEFKDMLSLDLLVNGQPRYRPEIPEVWLAVEISAVVDQEDLDRARRRAALLRQAGYRAIPAVAGERATLGAEDEARLHKVVVLQDGWVFLWEEALQAWAT